MLEKPTRQLVQRVGLCLPATLENWSPARSPSLLNERVKSKATILIAGRTHCDARRDLILAADRLILCRSDVRRECHEKMSSPSLLDRDVSSGRSLAASTRQYRIN